MDQTKFVTAASELARNTLDYGGGGTVQFEMVENERRSGLRLIFEDQGPGIADIELALNDGYTSGNGMGWDWAAPSGFRMNSRSGRNPVKEQSLDH